jgi:uncharacterized protein RhaS with RHS repeats
VTNARLGRLDQGRPTQSRITGASGRCHVAATRKWPAHRGCARTWPLRSPRTALRLAFLPRPAGSLDHLARWLSPDPIGEAGGVNLYGYVENSPLNWVDPLGLTLAGVPPSHPASHGEAAEAGAASMALLPAALAVGAMDLAGYALEGLRGGYIPDRWQHCMTSCRMMKVAGSAAAEVVGDWQEARGGDPGSQDSKADQEANRKGRSCPDDRSCEEHCRDSGFSP